VQSQIADPHHVGKEEEYPPKSQMKLESMGRTWSHSRSFSCSSLVSDEKTKIACWFGRSTTATAHDERPPPLTCVPLCACTYLVKDTITIRSILWNIQRVNELNTIPKNNDRVKTKKRVRLFFAESDSTIFLPIQNDTLDRNSGIRNWLEVHNEWENNKVCYCLNPDMITLGLFLSLDSSGVESGP